jgi:mitochondrial fission protein ELM1
LGIDLPEPLSRRRLRTVISHLTLWVVGDGKPGHENQSLGLAEALGRQVSVKIHVIRLAPDESMLDRLRSAFRQAKSMPRPDLILGAGHATHIALIALARRTGAPCIVLMKPGLPMMFFDLCLVPLHDLRGQPGEDVIATRGVLNRVPVPAEGPREGRLILIGGPSANHGWDGEAVLEAIGGIVAASPGASWELTDSRRTPEGFRQTLRERFPQIALFPHEETGPEWLPARLSRAGETWVTEDSVSMIHEALSSGSKVGLLPVPWKKPRGRIARGLARLIAEGFVTTFRDWKQIQALEAPPFVLREADRCAKLVLTRFR